MEKEILPGGHFTVIAGFTGTKENSISVPRGINQFPHDDRRRQIKGSEIVAYDFFLWLHTEFSEMKPNSNVSINYIPQSMKQTHDGLNFQNDVTA